MEPKRDLENPDHYREMLGAAALDNLDPGEQAMLDAFLADHPADMAELDALRASAAMLPLLLDDRAPSADLRNRLEQAVLADLAANPAPAVAPTEPLLVLDGLNPANADLPPVTPSLPVSAPVPTPIRATPPAPRAWQSRFWPLAAGLLFLISAGLLTWNVQLRSQLTAPAYPTVALKPMDNSAANATGNLTMMDNGAVVLLSVSDLPPLEPGHVYEVWMIGKDGAPVAAGSFDGSSARHAIAIEPGQYQALAITAEPGPMGMPSPTGTILAQAEMTAANQPS